MKFRLWIGLLLGLISSVGLALTTPPQDGVINSKSDLSGILKRGKLVSAIYYGDLPPFIVWKNGKPSGLAVELGQRFAHALGVKLEFYNKVKSFADIVDAVNRGRADIAISMLSRTTHRAMYVTFTAPYLNPHIWLLVSRLRFAGMTDQDIINKFMQKNDYTYVTYPQSAFTHLMTEYVKHGPKFMVSSTKDKIDYVAEHKVDACMIDALSAAYWLGNHPAYLVTVRPVEVPNIRDQLAIAVPYSAPVLASVANVFVSTLKLNGEIDRLQHKYFKHLVKLREG